MTSKQRLLEPIHPGEILLEEFMKPMGISINRLARDLAVPPGRISAIVNRKRAITADTALRLGRYFGTPPEVDRATKPTMSSALPCERSGLRWRSACFATWLRGEEIFQPL